MDAQQIIEYIRTSEKKTPVKVYVWEKEKVAFPDCWEMAAGEGCKIVFGDWKKISPAGNGGCMKTAQSTKPATMPDRFWTGPSNTIRKKVGGQNTNTTKTAHSAIPSVKILTLAFGMNGNTSPTATA